MLDAHDGLIDDARFWRAAATRALPEYGERHAALTRFDDFIERRQGLIAAQSLLNHVNNKVALGTIDEVIRQLENSPQARMLAPAVHSLRTLEAAVQDWSSAEFRAAGGKIEAALRAITETESNANIDLTDYRSWLMELQTALAELSVKRRGMLQEIDRQPDTPQATIRDAMRLQAEVTETLIGAAHAQMLVFWRDTYDQFFDIYVSDSLPSQKTEAMNELFKALFIERNPAYPLLRHWWRLLKDTPDEAVLAARAGGEREQQAQDEASERDEIEAESSALTGAQTRSQLSRMLFRVGAVVGAILVIGGLLSLAAEGDLNGLLSSFAPTSTATPAPTATSPPTEAPPSSELAEVSKSSAPGDLLPVVESDTEDDRVEQDERAILMTPFRPRRIHQRRPRRQSRPPPICPLIRRRRRTRQHPH